MDIQELKAKAELFLNDAKIQVEAMSSDLKNVPAEIEKFLKTAPEHVEKLSVEIQSAAERIKTGTYVTEEGKNDIKNFVSKVEGKVNQLLDTAKEWIQKSK